MYVCMCSQVNSTLSSSLPPFKDAVVSKTKLPLHAIVTKNGDEMLTAEELKKVCTQPLDTTLSFLCGHLIHFHFAHFHFEKKNVGSSLIHVFDLLCFADS